MKRIIKYLGEYIKKVDKILPVISLAITAFGLYNVNALYNAGYIKESALNTQFIAAIIGVVSALVISLIDYRWILKLWFIYTPVAVVLQLLLFTSLGIRRDDDIAWLDFGSFTVQPSEILKLVYIITLALHIAKLGDKLNSLPRMLLLCVHGLAPVGLILLQNDAGSALVFLFIFICMLFLGGVSWKYMAAAAVSAPVLIYVAWTYLMQDHHRQRFLILFDEELQQQELLGDYFQQYRGTVALGSGQLTGLGTEYDSFTYTPEIYNDFVFSFIGMTMGFIGCMAVVIALALLCLKLLSNSAGADSPAAKLVCAGVFAMVLFHSVINIGMALTVVPVIGIPLPFISTGGTSMIMMHASIGLVMSASIHKEKAKHMFYTED